MCNILSISKAAYYKWLQRTTPVKEILDHQLCELIINYDQQYKHILGYRRMTLFINHFNHQHYSTNYIHRLMKYLGIKAKIRQARRGYHKSTPETVAANLLNREFNANQPNQKWLTDVTEFRVSSTSKKLYLSVIYDLYDRSVIAHKTSIINNNQLVFDTFKQAKKRFPDAQPLFHSDRGYQYTSRAFNHMLKSAGMTQSMSRVGRCIDNGPMEGFFGIIKSEMYYLNKFKDIASLVQRIDEYIHFYNHQRLQINLKGLTPIAFRGQALTT